MSNLNEKLTVLSETAHLHKLPSEITTNLKPSIELRKYQEEAFRRFITYLETPSLKQKPTHVLFHMATGSGKTIIMAGLILHLYKLGYRKFMFFVNSDNIIRKTKLNFIDKFSIKYLFTETINIDGENIEINEVENFQSIDENAINICFTTVQLLHETLNLPKENSITIDDFMDDKIVLISDEAHHINADTKKGKSGENEKSWEATIDRILGANVDNILLEFTATMGLKNNENIKFKYENKLVFDYDLAKFREDKYSKEVKLIQSNLDVFERSIVAILLSQYRMKVFAKNNYNIKPVVLMKSKTIKESKTFQLRFHEKLKTMSVEDMNLIIDKCINDDDDFILSKMRKFYLDNNIEMDNLLLEIQNDFSSEHSINVNDDDELKRNQVVLNSLEDKDNRYRLIFAVNKLDEGWDVLNLFDIVRLYNTRDMDHKNGKIGKSTAAEAQLIGRGARYCPFEFNDSSDKYIRKFDTELENELRVCEELYYHSQQNSRYIQELISALKESGIMAKNIKTVTLKLKQEFIETELFKRGSLYVNEKRERDNSEVKSLDEKIKGKIHNVILPTIYFETENLLAENIGAKTIQEDIENKQLELKDLGIHVIRKALMKFNVFKFDIISEYYPNLKSLNEFIVSEEYLGGIKVNITGNRGKLDKLDQDQKLYIAMEVIKTVESHIKDTTKKYYGTKVFKPEFINSKIKTRTLNIQPKGIDGIGIAQSETASKDLRIDLKSKEWYVYEDNYGTSEEKSLVSYFDAIYESFKEQYKNIYLIRNEKAIGIYSFEDGNRFEPDYILLLTKEDDTRNEFYQVFIEPKGEQLKENDNWKEKLLVSLQNEDMNVIKNLYEDADVKILGLPFYNSKSNSEFDKVFKEIVSNAVNQEILI